MATLFDISLLQTFDVVFAAILVFAVVFALLRKTKVFGRSLGVDSIISVSTALLVVISDKAVEVINFMIPWFVVTFLFIMLLLLVYQVFGVGEKDIANYLRNDRGLGWLLFGVGLVIFVAALGNSFGQTLLEGNLDGTTSNTNLSSETGVATDNFQTNVISTLRHPKIIGMMIVLTIMVFAIGLLTGPADVK